MAVVAGWILFFYSTFCGLSAFEASLIFAISRLLDAVWSPLVGHISDHMGSTWLGRKFGRRRVFLLLTLPLMPSFAIMWVSGQTFWYYLLTYIFFELVYASVFVPYNTLPTEMTDDYNQRSLFTGVRMICAQASAVLAGILPNLIIATVGGKDSPRTFLIMGIIFTGLFMLVLLITYLFTWEREAPPQAMQIAKQEPLLSGLTNLFRNIGSTMRIRAFRQHLGMYLGGYISQDIFNAAFTYFVVFVIGGSVAAASQIIGWMYAAQFVAVISFVPLILLLQPAPSFRLASLLYAIAIVGLAVLYQLHPANLLVLIYIPMAIAGLGRGGLNVIPWNIYNYIADVDEIVTGERREGVFAGVMTFVRKLTMAVAIVAVGQILDAGGFIKSAPSQSPFTQQVIVAVLVIGPLLLLVMGIWISFGFKLDKSTHAILVRETTRFKSGQGEPPSDDDKRVLEQLSGWRYDQLWGRNDVARRPAS
jgi:oligogalacturonide transporter